MRCRFGLLMGLALLPAALHGQQPQAQPPQPDQSLNPGPPIVIYRIDLVPTGSIFAMNEPTLEGDTYVFRSLPERTVTRLPRPRVKLIVRRSADFEKEVVWQLDLVPSGRLLAREEPVLKGKTYIVRTWKEGTLLSVNTAEVRKVTRVTGLPAFRLEEEELGVVLLTPDPPAGPGGGNVSPMAAPTPTPALR